MSPQILPSSPTSEYRFAEGCFILDYSNTQADPALSIARARMEPGGVTRWHRLHAITERYVIQSGQGTIELGDLPAHEIGPGDVVVIPPMCAQRIRNTGKQDLIFLALCTPRFVSSAYEDIDSTLR